MYHSSAFVIRSIVRNEFDQYFTVYTKRFGKLTLIGRGTKKIISKLNPHMQQFSVVAVSFAQGKNKQLTAARVEHSFKNIKNNSVKILLGSFMLEIFDSLVTQSQPDNELFDMMVDFFSQLDAAESITRKEWRVFEKKYIVKLLTHLGYEPQDHMVATHVQLMKFLEQHINFELKTQRFIKQLNII